MEKYEAQQPLALDGDNITNFYGLNHNDPIHPGEFYDMENMSGDKAPAMAVRAPRYHLDRQEGAIPRQVEVMCDKDGLVWADKLGGLHAAGQTLRGFYDPAQTYEHRQLISMGGKVLLWPDRRWANAAKLRAGMALQPVEDYGSIDEAWGQQQSWQQGGSAIEDAYTVKAELCQKDGSYWLYDPGLYTVVEHMAPLPEDGTYLEIGVYPYQIWKYNLAGGPQLLGTYDGFYTEKPEKPKDGYLWLDGAELKKWQEATGTWQKQECYLRLKNYENLTGIRAGDSVEMTLPEYIYKMTPSSGEYTAIKNPLKPETYTHIYAKPDERTIVIKGSLPGNQVFVSAQQCMINAILIAQKEHGDSTYTEGQLWFMTETELQAAAAPYRPEYSYLLDAEKSMRISRTAPEMDYITESGNRIWGCYYGISEGKLLNEIYACRLGDFTNWRDYNGRSTASYAASRGIDGPWTGAVTHNNHPMFFKEAAAEKVYVSASGAHQIASIQMPGVQDGSYRSLSVIDGILYYKAEAGVMLYDGSLPRLISQSLGPERYKDAAAGSLAGKYYIAQTDTDGKRWLHCYNTRTRTWYKEDELPAVQLQPSGQALYVHVADEYDSLISIGYNTPEDVGSPEEYLPWMAQTGQVGYQRTEEEYLQSVCIRARLAPGTTVRLLAQYDQDGTWRQAGCYAASGGTGLQKITLTPRRCDHFALRLQGEGAATIYSIRYIVQRGSDET